MATYLTKTQFIEATRQCMLDAGLQPLTPIEAEKDWRNWKMEQANVTVPYPDER